MVDLAAGSPVGEPIRIDGWADIVGAATITDPEQLAALDSKLIWTLEYAESRLQWKKRQPLWVLAMRVHRLIEPLEVPWRDEYGGCTSWVDLLDPRIFTPLATTFNRRSCRTASRAMSATSVVDNRDEPLPTSPYGSR